MDDRNGVTAFDATGACRRTGTARASATSLATTALALIASMGLDAAHAASPYAAKGPLPTPQLFLPGLVSTADDDAHVTFAPDGRTMYFLKNSPAFDHWTMLVSRYANARWSEPEVAPFSGQYNDADLAISRDGKTAYFVSTRPVDGQAKSDTDLYVMHMTAGGWSEPTRIPELSSDGENEWFPSIADDGTLYFGSERRDGNFGPDGTSDLWRARPLPDGHFAPPENLGATLNTAGNDIEAYVAPDQSYLIFSSNGRKDTHGSYDLYVAYRDGDGWTAPQNLGDAVNSKGWEFGARVSPDGRYLFFTSNRGFVDAPLERRLTFRELSEKLHNPGNGLRDVYQVDIGVLPPRR